MAYSAHDPVFGWNAGLPNTIREAREAMWGLAAFGLAYPAVMGMTRGAEAAAAASAQFCIAWGLGLLAFGFTERAPGARRLALVLAIAQAVAGWRAVTDLATVPFGVGVAAACYSLGATAAVVHLLCRPEAKRWFGVRAC